MKIKKHLSVVASAILIGSIAISGCGSSSSPSDVVSTTVENTTTSISGVISDGPIYGATVNIVDVTTGKVLATTTTSSEDGSIGTFKVSVDNLPDTFIISSTGGQDSGADGIVNGNDRNNSMTIQTIAQKTEVVNGALITNATPATTLIAIVAQQNIANGASADISAANDMIVAALGFPTGTNLITADPLTDETAAQAAASIANLVDAVPASSTDVLKSIANVMIESNAKASSAFKSISRKKADDLAEGTVDESSSFSNLLTNTVDDLVTTNPGAINANDAAKIKKAAPVLGAQINSIVSKSKPINTMTELEKATAIASETALDVINNKISNEIDASTISNNDLTKLANGTQKTFERIMLGDGGLDAVDNTNMSALTSVIEENIDQLENISDDTFQGLASKSKELSKKIFLEDFVAGTSSDIASSIFNDMFVNMDFTDSNSLDAFDSFDDSFINNVVSMADDLSNKVLDNGMGANTADNFTENYSTVIGAKLVSQMGEGQEFDFDAIAQDSFENELLFDSFSQTAQDQAAFEEKVMIGDVSAEEISAFLAADMKVKTMADNFRDVNFAFDAAAMANFDKYEETTMGQFSDSYKDLGTPDFNPDFDITNSMKAMESAAGLMDFSDVRTDFDTDFINYAGKMEDFASEAELGGQDFNFQSFGDEMAVKMENGIEFDSAYADIDFADFKQDFIKPEDIQGDYIPGENVPPVDGEHPPVDGEILPPVDGEILPPVEEPAPVEPPPAEPAPVEPAPVEPIL